MTKALVFDLGGVLVELTPVSQVFERVFEGGENAFWRYWLHSPAVRRFETGGASLEEFIAAIKAEMHLTFDDETLIQRHRSFVKGVYPGVYELLDQLRGNYRLVSLSNNNPVHWPIMMKECGLEQRFEQHFPSHQTGLIKPDAIAFENVIEQLGIKPAEALFVDDNSVNVEGAKQVGLQAYQTKGVEEAKRLFQELGLIA